MKKAKSKKLSLQKLSIAKLNNMSVIKAGHHRMSDRPTCGPDQVFYIYTKTCKTKAINCTSPTIIGA
ncbi:MULTISPECIES: hypothetical protein [Aquimarina]|uniref:hypothetical protein n=1 Tax=Aquimarina TaxID=290174 RepID=UPI00082C1FF9|nr:MULTISPECIES: hypothetical protein [Aquimarina]